MLIDDNYDSLGWFVDEANLSGATWTSSNNSIATVDNNGKVTGVAEGKTTITAKYNNETANYEVNVISNTEKPSFYVTMRVRTEGGSITSEQGLVSGATSVEKGKDLKIYWYRKQLLKKFEVKSVAAVVASAIEQKLI